MLSAECLTIKVLNFWKFTSYCSLKPLWSDMGEVVPARTSPTLHPPSPPSVHQLLRLALEELIFHFSKIWPVHSTTNLEEDWILDHLSDCLLTVHVRTCTRALCVWSGDLPSLRWVMSSKTLNAHTDYYWDVALLRNSNSVKVICESVVSGFKWNSEVWWRCQFQRRNHIYQQWWPSWGIKNFPRVLYHTRLTYNQYIITAENFLLHS